MLTLLAAAGAALYAGTLAARDALGRAVPASDTAGLRIVGRVLTTSDNTGGPEDSRRVCVERGCFRYANSATAPLIGSDVGKVCFVEDNQTVASASTNSVKAGRVVEVDAEGVWVNTADTYDPAPLVLATGEITLPDASDLASAIALLNAEKAALRADLEALAAILRARGFIA